MHTDNTQPVVEVLANGRVERRLLQALGTSEVLASSPIRSFTWYQGQHHFPGWYWSATDRAHVAYESRLELAWLRLADFSSDVTAIRSQPFQLLGRDASGRSRRHVPDFALVGTDGAVTIVNVKLEEKLSDPKVRDALGWAHDTFEAHGFETEIWTGASATLLRNIQFLAGYRNPRLFAVDELEVAVDRIRGSWRFGEAETVLAAAGLLDAKTILLHLIWRHALVCDLEERLDRHTRVVAP